MLFLETRYRKNKSDRKRVKVDRKSVFKTGGNMKILANGDIVQDDDPRVNNINQVKSNIFVELSVCPAYFIKSAYKF